MRNIAFFSLIVVGFGGIVLAVNAALSNSFTGAGLCLFASAVAFGVVAFLSVSLRS